MHFERGSEVSWESGARSTGTFSSGRPAVTPDRSPVREAPLPDPGGLFQRILIPLDGTPESEVLPGLLGVVCRRMNSEVLLAQAESFIRTLINLPKELAPGTSQASPDLEIAQRRMSTLVGRLRDEGIQARGFTRMGEPGEVTLNLARKEGASLIALSRRTLKPLFRRIRDRAIGKPLRESPIPMLVFGASPPSPADPLFLREPRSLDLHKILLPLGDSTDDPELPETLLRLARTFSSRIVVLHLVGRSRSSSRALALMRETMARLDPASIPADSFIHWGDPATEIARVADQQSIGMIVLPGWSPLRGIPVDEVILRSLLKLTRIPLLLL